MTNLVFFLMGCGSTASGALLGYWLRAKKTPKLAIPRCPCGHVRSTHDVQAGGCQATVQTESGWDKYGTPVRWQHVVCACQRYEGPVPIQEFFGPTLTLPEVDSQ